MRSDCYESRCCVCLVQEEVMIYVHDTVENFNKTLASLLETCGDLKIEDTEEFSKLICEECTKELIIAAKFREKCIATKEILEQFTHTKNDSINIYEEDMELHNSEMTTDSQLETASYKMVEILDDNIEDQTTYEEVEYLDSNAIEVYDLNTETSKDSIVGDDIIDETNFSNHLKLNSDIKDKSQNTTKVVVNYTCRSCGAGFTHLNNLQRHILFTHDKSKTATFVCSKCSMIFNDKTTYINHLSTHNDEDLADAIFTKDDVAKKSSPKKSYRIFDSKTKASKKKQFACQYCKRLFASRSLTLTHERVHTGERPFQCTLCDKTFTTQGGLDLHTRRHLGRKPFVCTYCNKGFVESSNLKVHLRIHTGEKPHKCNRCDRSFSRVFLLQIHQRTHTGERPYSCPICQKAFAQQGDLTAHKRIHTGERPHVCNICDKGFIKSSGLSAHLRRHERIEIQLGADDALIMKASDDQQIFEERTSKRRRLSISTIKNEDLENYDAGDQDENNGIQEEMIDYSE